ncbi:restriction endonuclease S subunit [Sinorhizobium americanum CCGM7]|uniref:restriction endonuclease subunit S n=1 Tax=Sinorhizobium americanum TaxID=194963 RepID=UPI0004DAE179|nr:restriction endonuclease subunit S [Sinorhizobium americanum]APG86130.1 restriction endonuclease S subunit [Sinorhizobium americanum CCGM7]
MSRDVPEGWRKEALSELASYINGRAFKPTDWSSHGLPIIRIANMTSPEAEFNSYPGDDLDEGHLVNDGDILFSWSATLSIMKWCRGPGILNQHIFKVVPAEFVHPDWLLYVLQHEVEDLAGQSHGSTMKHIKKGVLKTHLVGLPPFHEQRRIAEILSSVDDAIDATRAVIEQTIKVKQGVLERLLTKGIGHTRFAQTEIGEIPEGWELHILDDLTPGDRRITYGIVQAGRDCPGGVPYIRVSDMGTRDVDEATVMRTSPEIANGYRRSELRAGDLIFALRGKVGHVLKTPPSLDGGNLTQGTARIACGKRVLEDFLLWALRAPQSLKQYNREVKGSTFQELTLGSLKKIKVVVPSIDEQRTIAFRMNDLDTALKITEAELASLRAVKDRLMSDLLTGRKRVTDPLPMAAE